MKNYTEYIAYDAAANEYEHFEDIEEAKEWITGQDFSDGFPSELIEGDCFIAKITHRSTVKITNSKENYRCLKKPDLFAQCNSCDKSQECDGEEWPYGKDWIGEPYMEKIESDDLNRGIWFRSAITGLWYRSRKDAGGIDGWKEDGLFHDIVKSTTISMDEQERPCRPGLKTIA